MQNVEGKRERIYRKGEQLFNEGDSATELYIVQSGELRVYRSSGGREFEIGVLGKGSVIGEMALFDSNPRSASVQARTDCRVVYIDKDHFAQQLEKVPSWMAAIIRIIIKRLRDTDRKLHETAGKDLSGRVARLLEYVYARHRIRGGGEEYVAMEKANNEITAIAGIGLEQLGETYEALINRKLISIDRGRVFVPRPELLVKYAEYRDGNAAGALRMSPTALKLLNAVIFFGDKQAGSHAKKVEFALADFSADFEKMTGNAVGDDELNELHRLNLVQFVREGRIVSPSAGQEAKTLQYNSETARALLEEQKLFLLFETGSAG